MSAGNSGPAAEHGGPVLTGTTAALSPVIPDLDLIRPIGRGAYGEVWLARHRTLDTLRAIKIVRRADFDDDRPFRREFDGIRHYEPISRGHPNLVAVLHVGGDAAAFYYVMELADAAGQRTEDRGRWAEDRGRRAEGGGEDPTAEIRKPKTEVGDGGSQVAEPGPPLAARGSEPVVGDTPKAERGVAIPGPSVAEDDLSAYIPRTLRSELKRRGHLTADEATALGGALAGALAHLHAHALVHRDVKPSNIIFVEGVPKLADIGLVTDVSDSRSFVGTEGYIPPEGPGTTAADCYALGKVLYELTTGRDRRDFPEPPPDLATRPDRERLLELNAIVHRACAPDPRQRYPTGQAMQADLERLAAGDSIKAQHAAEQRWAMARKVALPVAGCALATALLVAALRPTHRVSPVQSPPALAAAHSIFVLPFRPIGTNGPGADLCGRVTDAFIDSLGLVPGVAVGPRKSGWVAQDEDALRRSLARTNAMRHLLTGRLAGEGSALTITLRLYVNGEDSPLWTQTFSGSTNQVIEFERRGLASIAAKLGFAIPEATQQKIDLLLTNNLEALGWYREASLYFASRGDSQPVWTEVMRLNERGMSLDPRFLDADQLDAYMLRSTALDRAPVEIWPTVRRRMEAVLKQDDTHAGALNQLGGYMLFFERDWAAFDTLHEREVQSLSGASRHFVQAWWSRNCGRMEDARREQILSETPEPTHSDHRYIMSTSRWADRDYDGAIRVARRTLAMYPDHYGGRYCLAQALVAKGEIAEGLTVIRQAQAIWNGQECTTLLAVAHARQGERGKAEAVLRELLDQGRSRPYVNPYFVARVYAVLGEKDQALNWLQKAIDERSDYVLMPDLGGLRTDWAWDGLQDEPRYWQLCEQIGLGKNQWPR